MMQIQKSFEFLIHPKIVSGKCALENIPFELDGYDARKPLVITSKDVIGRGLDNKLVKAFYDSVTVIGAIYDEVLDYAGISQAHQAAELFTQRGCDALIALGNGPVVDLAKAVNVLVSENRATLRPDSLGTVVSRPLKPLFLVPGCAFNGWEATHTMIVDNRRLQSEYFFPETIFIDSRITEAQTPEQPAASGAIAIAQALEALSLSPGNPMADAIAHPALRLLDQYLIQAVQCPEDQAACLAVANAAVMAGAAMTNSGPPITLLLAESLGSAVGIAPGKLMPVLQAAHISIIQSKERAVREELCLAITGLESFAAMSPEERTPKALERLAALFAQLTQVLPRSFQAVKIQSHLLNQTAEETAAAGEGRFSEEECRLILQQAWENGEVVGSVSFKGSM